VGYLEAEIKPWDVRRQDAGQGLAEYALILAVIAVVVIAAIQILGAQVNSNLANVGTSI
jgi:pilus assembly protein Flp/PilA